MSRRRAGLALLLLLPLASCSILKARPAKVHSNFLAHFAEHKEMRERSPMLSMWFKDRPAFYSMKEKRQKISVARVETGFLESKIREEFSSPERAVVRIEEAREVASYMRDKFISALKDIKTWKVQIVDEPDAETFIVELAIIDLQRTNNTTPTSGSSLKTGPSSLPS